MLVNDVSFLRHGTTAHHMLCSPCLGSGGQGGCLWSVPFPSVSQAGHSTHFSQWHPAKTKGKESYENENVALGVKK